MVLFIAAISLGLLGSLHCVGMCGPIALALPLVNRNRLTKIYSILLYNFGRTITYFIIGLFFGMIGTGFNLFGLQQILSVLIGTIILLAFILPSFFVSKLKFTSKTMFLFNYLKSKLSHLLSQKTLTSHFYIGLLNGLLPCGLVYLAIAGAVATGDLLNGGIFMAIFGLGTIPAMFLVSWFGHYINLKFRSVIMRSMPYVVSVMAILLILRGLNLGIPYLSPKMDIKENKINCCATNEISAHKNK